MAIPPFRSFFPAVDRWIPTRWRQEYRLIVNADAVPVGIQNQNANGADGIWGLTPLSSDEIASPTQAMLDDLGATYQLDEYPYSRYRSDGLTLLPMDETGGEIIPAIANEVWFSPIIVTEDNGPLIIQGGLRVIE